jgi:hypothetical protein
MKQWIRKAKRNMLFGDGFVERDGQRQHVTIAMR